MTLYVTAKTDCPDVLIDFIELELRSGEIVSLTWDESGIDRADEGFNARYKGVLFGEEYANGRIDELEGCNIVNVELYSPFDATCSITITEMIFEDNGAEYVIPNLHYIVEVRKEQCRYE